PEIRIQFGSTVVFDSTMVPIGTTDAAANGEQWNLECQVVCRTTGSSGSVHAEMVQTVASTTTGSMAVWMGPSQNSSTVTLNTTTSQQIKLMAQWAAPANSSKSITCVQFDIEVLD